MDVEANAIDEGPSKRRLAHMTADYGFGGGLFSWTICGRRGVCWTAGADTYRSQSDMKELVRRNQIIEEQIRKDKIAQKKILKILLLGMRVLQSWL